MVERTSSRILLALVAMLGLALGTACNKKVRAQERGGQEVEETTVDEQDRERVGGGPIEAPESEVNDPAPVEQPEQMRDDMQSPEPQEDLGEDDANEELEQHGPTEGREDDEAPQETDEEQDQDNWRMPVRGSGGDNPPDFIETAEPKTV
jgi:hypothetical protein